MAAEQWGVLSLNELLACGLSEDGVSRRVASRRLLRVHRGVYAVGHDGLSMRGRFLAAVKACGDGAVLSHVSAAALWDLLPYDEDRPPDVIARGPRRIAGINTRRSNHPPPTIRYDNIPVTTPARTLADLSSMLPFKTLRRAAREALALKRITPKDLEGTKLGRPARDTQRAGRHRPRPHHRSRPPPARRQQATTKRPDTRLPLARPQPHPRSRRSRLPRPPARTTRRRTKTSRTGTQGDRVLRISYLQAVTNPHHTIERLKESLDTDPAPTESPARGSPPTPAA